MNTVDLHWNALLGGIRTHLTSSFSSLSLTSEKVQCKKKSREQTSKNLWQPKWHIEWNHTGSPSFCALERNPKITQPDKFLTLWNKKTFVSPTSMTPPPLTPQPPQYSDETLASLFSPQVPDFPLLCCDHEKDCTKSNSADTDQRRRWRFSSSSSSLSLSLHPLFLFLHIEEIKENKKGQRDSEMKRKRKRERRTRLPPQSAIPGACGEQRSDRDAVWRRWIQHTQSLCGRGVTLEDDRRVETPPRDTTMKPKPAKRETANWS